MVRTGFALVGFSLVAALAGCGSGSHVAGDKSAGEPTSTSWAPPPPPDGTTTLINTGEYTFRSPSGNIGCHVIDRPNSVGARCEVTHFTYPPPDNPGVGCPKLNSITIGVDGPSQFTCEPDIAAGTAPVLAYWDSVQVGRFTCKSKDVGVTCENTQTSHGFDLGSAAFRRY